jgi:ribosomal protein S27AE
VATDQGSHLSEDRLSTSAAPSEVTYQRVSDTGGDWWKATDGQWNPLESNPNGRAAPSDGTFHPEEGWWEATDGKWYPPESHPDNTASPTDSTYQRVPEADEVRWQATEGQWSPPVADESMRDSVDDLASILKSNESRRRSTEDATHDFGDGSGSVPAHRHVNGGGWVANTATVSRTAFVGPEAAVFESSKVLGKASVIDRAQVRGRSEISGNARVSGNAVIDGDTRINDGAQDSDHASTGALHAMSPDKHVGGDTQLNDRAVSKGSSFVETSADQLVSCDNGHSVSSALNFCPVCGVAIAASPNSLRCSRCGTKNLPDASFCTACGCSLAIRIGSATAGPFTPVTGESPPPGVAVEKRPRNPLSVWSIVLLLLGSLGALVAIPMGFVARRQIRRSHGQQKGAGLALAAIIIGFVFVGITLAVAGLALAGSGTSGGSGPSLSGLTSTVRAQIAGNGSDSLKVPGVASVVCDPPNSWQTGEHFTCIAYGSTGSKIGDYDGTVEPDSSPGRYKWNASWYPTG